MGVIENAQTWIGKGIAFIEGGQSQEAFSIMNDWNQLKNDMYEGRLINDFGISGGSDNLCRVGAGIEIGQKAAKLKAEGKEKEAQELIDACLKWSSRREDADTIRKTLSGGSNKDADKDEENIRRGIEIGLNNPTTDKWQILAKMDLKTGEFKEGYNNGYADFIKKNYKMGQDNKPNFSKKEGQAIATLIKSGACADLKEALAFMDKYKDRAPEVVTSASNLANTSRGAMDFKQSLAIAEKNEETRQNNLALRNDMKNDNQTAISRINMAKSAETARGAKAKKKTVKKENPNIYFAPWNSNQTSKPKATEWPQYAFPQKNSGR